MSTRTSRCVWAWGFGLFFPLSLASSCAHLDDRDCSVTRTCVPAGGSGGQGGQDGEEAAAGAPRED